MSNAPDILKIQKTIRKAIKDYTITAKYDEEVLISLVSVDLYLNLSAKEVVSPAAKPKRNAAIATPVVIQKAVQEE